MNELKEEIRDAIIGELYGRKGFDDWWDNIDNDVLDELNEILRAVIAEKLNQRPSMASARKLDRVADLCARFASYNSSYLARYDGFKRIITEELAKGSA